MRRRYRTEAEILEDIGYLERTLKRLSETFRLEKEQVLEWDNAALEKLRERERSHYGPQLRQILSELRRFRYRLKTMQDLPPAIFHSLEELEKKMKDTGAHFTGTVNRLLRCRVQGDGECTE